MILSGRKTQTRRIWKKPRAKVGAVHLAKTKMLSREYFAKLRILDVYREFPSDISDDDARAEGYDDASAVAITEAEYDELWARFIKPKAIAEGWCSE
jgi:hypothetical protein